MAFYLTENQFPLIDELCIDGASSRLAILRAISELFPISTNVACNECNALSSEPDLLGKQPSFVPVFPQLNADFRRLRPKRMFNQPEMVSRHTVEKHFSDCGLR